MNISYIYREEGDHNCLGLALSLRKELQPPEREG